jgi:uncharacterized repeat protein (TIGR02543 family)
MQIKRSKFNVFLALILVITIILLPMDTLALVGTGITAPEQLGQGATPDEAIPKNPDEAPTENPDNATKLNAKKTELSATGAGGAAQVNGTDYASFAEALSAWTSGSTLTLTDDVTTDSTITVPSGAHTLDLNGHGIRMTGWGSVFYIEGGAKLIINDSNTGTQHKFDIPDGAGLASLNEASGAYTVSGGYITGGNADNGGGIYIAEEGEVVMNGGALIGNHADDNGAGIRMEKYTSFTLSGGEIAYNQASVHGGGIGNAYSENTVITVNGGAIHHNLCQYSGGAMTLNGDSDSYLYLYGGEIRDNASVSDGGNNPWHPGGIAGNANIHVKGMAKVYNNINLSSSNIGASKHNIEINASENDFITLDGPLSKGARIAVSYHTSGDKSTGVFTSGWSTYMGSADPSEYFVSDYDDYSVVLSNGEAEINIPAASVVHADESTTAYKTVQDAINAAANGETVQLLSDVPIDAQLTISNDIIFDLNGYGLISNGAAVFYAVERTWTLTDSSPNRSVHYYTVDENGLAHVSDDSDGADGSFTGGYITGTVNTQATNACMFVKDCNTTMTGGTFIGNKNSGDIGGAVYVRDSGTFTMKDGAFLYNICGSGGAIAINSGTLNIQGGTISHNKASDGGGVFTWSNYHNVVVNISGGMITDNRASSVGGGVCFAKPSRNKNTTRGTISGGVIAGNIAENGGGISVDGRTATQTLVTMTGGTIEYNEGSGNTGGVLLLGGTTFTMTGGSICHNAGLNFGGIGTSNATMAFSGDIDIRDNYIYSDGTSGKIIKFGDSYTLDTTGGLPANIKTANANDRIHITAPLTPVQKIGVIRSGNTGVFTTDWSTYMSDADPADYFMSDSDNYTVIKNDDGEAEIIEKSAATITIGGSTAYYADLSSALSAWTEGSTLKLLDDVTTDSTITVPSGTHTLDLNGHGILMTGNDRVITINQGASLELNDSDPDRIHYITLTNYRGTAVSDSGEESVSNGSGVIQVKGGYLTGGYRNNSGSHDRCGAGVYNWGTFVMNGGSIVGNTLYNNSGGAIRNSGYFTMNGGTIAFNYASGNGGGVTTYVPGGSQGKMTMNGGMISDNYCGSYGGGIQIAGPIEMTGGSVVRNTAGTGGSGVYYDGKNDRFKLSGNPVIKDNNNDDLYLGADATFMINGSLTEGADIHILMNTPAEFTVGWKNIMGSADPSKYFTSGNSGYVVILNSNGEAEVGLPPVASVISGETTANYSSVSDAVNAWTEGSTLKLLDDVTTNSTITVPSGAHTLDLNGYSLKAGSAGYSVVTVGSGANLTVDDSSESSGKITGGSVGLNYGGGVTVDGGTLTLKGGAISGNANTYGGIDNCGGGVHVRSSGKFYMVGGEISGNTSYVGGGICTDSSATTVSVTGGVIKNNQTVRFGSAIWAGRTDASVFKIGGDAQIIDNISTWTSDKDGEGTINFTTLTLSGDPTIYGAWKTSGTSSSNTHINLDNLDAGVQLIGLDGALTNGTGTPKITISPIYRWSDLENGQTFVFTNNWSAYMGTAHPAGYFKVDDGVSGVRVIRKNGEAAITGGSDLGDLYIFFDSNSGSGTMNPQLSTSTAAVLNKNTFTRSGYGFVGWNTKADGSGVSYADEASVTLSGDLMLYAQWVEDPDLFEGKGTEAQPYLIQSSDDWDALSNYINNGGAYYSGKHFKLTNDISVTTTLGNRPDSSSDSNDNYFSGVFDGDYHILTVNIDDPVFAAPFAVAHNATIKNLHVTGTVHSSGNHATGLVAASKGRSVYDDSSLTIQNVTVSAAISCNSHVAGIVGHAHKAAITMENVVFDGSISASSVQGGFIGWGGVSNVGFNASFKDCLFIGTYNSGAAFCPVAFASGQGSVTLMNDFYTLSMGSGGSPITPTGDGEVKLLVAAVEKDGKVKYFADVAAASNSENWTADSTLKLLDDVTTNSTITVPSGAHTLDLNGHTITRTGAAGNDNSGLAMTVGDGVQLTVTGPGKITGGNGFHGGGIHVEGNSSVVLDNCEISGNTGHYGGGLYLNQGTITLKNGTVVKQNSASEGYGGSGIYAEGGGTLIMDGCSFTDNEIRNNNQYAVFLCGNANIQLGGAPVINNNTYGSAQKNLYMFQAGDQHSTVQITGALTDGAKIAVGQTTGAGVFTNGWSTYMGNGDPAKYFISDNIDYVILLNNGEAEISYPALTGVSAVGFEGDYDGAAHGITVSAPDGAAIEYGTTEGSYTLSVNPTYTDAGTYTVYYKVSLDKHIPVYGSAEIKINQINAVVNVTGNSSTVDYDGTSHKVSGYTATADTGLYDVTKDFTFSGTAEVTRTDAGTTNMGLAANQFENTNGNFKTVTFNVTDGSITVNPIDVTVTITGHNITVDYDGKAHSADGYDAVASTDLYHVADDFTYRGRAEAVRTEVGTTDMGLSAEDFENTNSNFAAVTFNVTDGYITVNTIDVTVTITGHNNTVDYDGDTHIVSDYDVVIGNPLYTESDFTFSSTAYAEQTNAGTANMGLTADQFENTNSNFATVTFNVTDGYITVNPIDVTVTITGHNSTVDYDGDTHIVSGYDVVIGNPLYTESDFTFISTAYAEQTNAGTVNMGLTADQFENTNGNFANVTFNVTDGYITVNPIDVTVAITGHNSTVDYDGDTHIVSGYDVTIGNPLYTESDFTFISTAYAEQTNAGTANMGLAADQFENTNSNFATVTFNVTDGYITVNPIDVTVTITGHNSTVDYDGESHSVSGYDVVSGNPLYTESDFTFSGTAYAEQTNAGTANMGLAAEQFENINGNFANVTFNVTDGYITVNPIDVTVTITGHTDSFDYDGMVHTISGYDAVASSALYDVTKDFTFSGMAVAGRTDAGLTKMNLAADQFTNTNPNFAHVTFNVTDGYITVGQIDAIVTITGHHSTVDYDGKAHTVSGYDVAINNPLYTEADFTFGGTAYAEQTNAGTAKMNLSEDQYVNTNSNFKTVAFVVSDGSVTVNPIDVTVAITGHNITVDYDGKAHSADGYDAVASTDLYDVTDDFTYRGRAEAVRTDAGTTDMGLRAEDFENTNSNFANVTFDVTDGYITVNSIDVTVTITGHNITVDYDGKAHSADGYDAAADSDLYDVADDFTYRGRAEAVRTDAGTTDMGLRAEDFENTNSNFANVTFDVTDGYITVNPIDVTVTITGHTDTVDYDGESHSVSGYDVSISNPLYTESDFTFSGMAEATRTDAGTTNMGLRAEDFENTNSNFANVTFDVTDGYITVNPIDVTVTITGHTDTVDYDGESHSVSGYDVSISNPLYTESDFTFGGTAYAEQTNAGTANMGLTADQFENTNSNFANVTFNVTDGYITVGQIDVTVTITGHTGTVDYDGQSHTVTGYDVVISDPAYKESDFTFSGTAEATRTDAGITRMNLTAEQFTNTNPNFANVTFNVTDGYITVGQIDVTVTITGHTGTVDYDGQPHTVTGYDIIISDPAYKESDFTFSGTAEATRTDAGTAKMNLSEDQFENTNGNFKTVVFNVSDGSVTVNPIDVTVTITGHNITVEYDGKAHSADGYDAVASTDLYDVSGDFTYHGRAEAVRTDAGTTDMGLRAEDFENTNSNFATVTFNVTDGYIIINTVDAVITSAPKAKDELVYNDSEQELIDAGTAEGGTLYYAIGSDEKTAPSDSEFRTDIPVGKEVGNYYIWYKVEADANHNSLAPACVKITLAEEEWTTVSGMVYDSSGNPVSGAAVSLVKGSKTIDEIISGSDGSYYFTAPAGVYNIVVKTDGATVTERIDTTESTAYDIGIGDANTSYELDVVGSDADIVVDGLSKEAESVREQEQVSSDKNVSVKMTVTPVSGSGTSGAAAIEASAPDRNLEYYDIKVEKTVDSVTTTLDKTQNVLELAIPCSFTNKKELTVYSSGASGVQTLTQSGSGESGTFRVDADAGMVYVYTDQISTYALGYKPYYSVKSEMTLGDFTGSVSVKLTKDDGSVYTLDNVSLDNVSFKGIPKGNYSMTITWTDGAENTLTTPFIIK